jgi:hypothetical protein
LKKSQKEEKAKKRGKLKLNLKLKSFSYREWVREKCIKKRLVCLWIIWKILFLFFISFEVALVQRIKFTCDFGCLSYYTCVNISTAHSLAHSDGADLSFETQLKIASASSFVQDLH